MKPALILSGFLILVFLLALCVSCTPQEEVDISSTVKTFPLLSGPYLGQEHPGLTPEIFAPGVYSTSMGELNAAFFPGGKKVIFSVSSGPMSWALVIMEEVNGQWQEPVIAPFSGRYGDVDPFVTSDGNRIYYCSNRPRDGSNEAAKDFDIWYVEKSASGWSQPINPGAPINSDTHEFYPVITRSGTIYFQSRREGGIGGPDIYRAELIEGEYKTAELLPEPVNSVDFEGDTFVDPDEEYLIISTRRSAENYGQSDLYISFRAEDGSWSELKNMGEKINSKMGENCAILSPDGKYLFFTSRQYSPGYENAINDYQTLKNLWNGPGNGQGDIYWVSAEIIDAFRTQ